MSGTKVLDDHPEYAHKQLTILWIDCKNKKQVISDLKVKDLQVVEGEVVAIIPNVAFRAFWVHRINFLLVVEKVV